MQLNKATLSEQIYTILKNDILDQSIPQGEKLTLKNLQERFATSSTPIRDALTRLTEEGLVNYYSNVGVTVINLSEKDIRELYHLSETWMLWQSSMPLHILNSLPFLENLHIL